MPTTPISPFTTDHHAFAARIARIGRMLPRELREAYRHTFGRETNSGNRAWLVRAISNRLREIEESHQRPRALAMAQAVAKDLGCEDAFARYLQTLSSVAPLPRMPEEAFETLPSEGARDPRIPPPGTVLGWDFGDSDDDIAVTEQGFMLGRHR